MSTRRGFTLMEVMVVVSIICILAAILFPVFARAREKARQCRCQSNLQQIGLALGMYARDHAGHLPPNQDDLTPLLGRYLLQEEVLHCPSRTADPRQVVPNPEFTPPEKVPEVDYFYRAGFCDDDDPGTPIVCDSDLARHNGGANALMADGHSKWFKYPYGSSGYTTQKDPWKVILEERKGYIATPAPLGAPGGVSP